MGWNGYLLTVACPCGVVSWAVVHTPESRTHRPGLLVSIQLNLEQAVRGRGGRRILFSF